MLITSGGVADSYKEEIDMSEHTPKYTQSQLPFDEGEYAPWVAIYGLRAPYRKCQCGCGQDAPIAKQSDTKKGHVKGEPMRYVARHKSIRSLEEQFWSTVEHHSPDDCWIWIGNRSGGRYGRLRNHGRRWSSHRASYEIHYGPIPDGMFVCHTCDNPACVNPKHLFLGTANDNMQDKINKGRQRHLSGESNPASRLTVEQVTQIRQRAKQGEIQRELAQEFGVTQSTVSEIVLYKIWRNVP
jgi:predicted XRE-type DNA-binding protein